MKRLLDLLSKVALVTSAACIVAMTAIITYQVIARYVFNASPSWSERLALLLLGYLVFLGAAVGVHEKFHIRIDAIRNAVPRTFGNLFDIVAHLAVALSGIVLILAGYQLTSTLWEFAIPALGLPRGLALLPILIAGGLITIFSTAHLIDAVGEFQKKAD